MARGDTREVVDKELLLSNPLLLYFVVAVFLNFEGRGGVDVQLYSRLMIIV